MNPKRLSYIQAGWKFLDLQPPAEPQPEGKEYAINGYTDETSADIRPVFKLVALNLRARTFSKLRLVTALTKRGIWAAFRDWLTETDLYDLFLAGNDFREDHPQFAAALSAAQTRFHSTPSETAAILAESAAPKFAKLANHPNACA